MKRIIKFRGKFVGNGKWTYGDLISFGYKMLSIFDDDTVSTLPLEKLLYDNDVLPETVGQFTGLLDETGKEIYEGDILEGKFLSIGERRALVVFVGKAAAFMVKYEGRDTATAIFNCGWFDEGVRCKVIGNIYDNPKLFKMK